MTLKSRVREDRTVAILLRWHLKSNLEPLRRGIIGTGHVQQDDSFDTHWLCWCCHELPLPTDAGLKVCTTFLIATGVCVSRDK